MRKTLTRTVRRMNYQNERETADVGKRSGSTRKSYRRHLRAAAATLFFLKCCGVVVVGTQISEKKTEVFAKSKHLDLYSLMSITSLKGTARDVIHIMQIKRSH